MKKVFLIFLIFFSFINAQNLEQISLQLKWKYQFQFAGFIIAKEKGFYKDLGLDVNILEFDPSKNTMEDLEMGNIDFAIDDSSLILKSLKGEPIIAMMSIFQSSPHALMALKSSGINTLEDIKGKKIAFNNSLNGIAINAMLMSNNINYTQTAATYSLDKFLNAKNDLQAVYLSNEPYAINEEGIQVNLFNPKDYGFDVYGDILYTSKKILKNKAETVEKMYKASMKGWEYAYSHVDESVEIIYKKYNTLNKSKKALLYEATILKELSGYDKNFGELNKDKIKSIAQIFSFMDKGKKNFENLDEFIYKPTNKYTDNDSKLFTQEEVEYIKNKKTVKVCAYTQSFPYVIFNKEEISGTSIEFLKHITNKTKLNFEIIRAESIHEYFKMLKDGLCDVISIMVTKPNLHDFILPTKPILSDTIVLVTKINEPYVNNFNDLRDKKIAIVRGATSLVNYVNSIYPDIQLTEIDSEGLKKVANKEFYGYIGPSYHISYKIATEYFNELKIMSKLGNKKIDGSFGITEREPILLSIFNKSIDNISLLEKQNIENAWLSIKVDKQFDYTYFIQLMGVAIIIILILIFSYFKQKKLHKKIKILNDTLEKRIVEEVEKNKNQQLLLLHQNRLAQMGEMISMIAHQWRQPLNNLAILNQTIILKYKKGKLDNTLMESFKENSKKQINQMSNTIDDFKNFFKPEKEKSEFLINDTISHVLNILNPILEKNNISIKFEEENLFQIFGYPNELGQAILNIIINAKDALIENNIENKKIALSLKQNNENIVLSIIDNAGGIPEEIIYKIFDPYFSTKEVKNGTGLGLYMAKMIIDKHIGAKLLVQNCNNGAEFIISFKNTCAEGVLKLHY